MPNYQKDEIIRLHAEFCSALSDTNRLLILYTLSEGPLKVTDLAEQLDIPQPTISRHLKVLRERGMVSARRDGPAVFYSLGDRRVIQALDLLRAMMADNLKNQLALTAAIE
ncbi:MAG: winged helix-turn-helix transcriptional regulator [Chloroflexi bacterium]|nr:winged helix-turn-helix transcriptional regulator [Chloroflexota bacterium]